MLKVHKAQKDHICGMCGRKIPKGDKYYRDFEADSRGMILKDKKEHTSCVLYDHLPVIDNFAEFVDESEKIDEAENI